MDECSWIIAYQSGVFGFPDWYSRDIFKRQREECRCVLFGREQAKKKEFKVVCFSCRIHGSVMIDIPHKGNAVSIGRPAMHVDCALATVKNRCKVTHLFGLHIQ